MKCIFCFAYVLVEEEVPEQEAVGKGTRTDTGWVKTATGNREITMSTMTGYQNHNTKNKMINMTIIKIKWCNSTYYNNYRH